MIDWLFQSTLDISILIALILLIRNPIRRLLGANISYWLWSLPLIRLLLSDKFERPQVITNYIQLPDSNDIIPLYTGPIQASDAQITVTAGIWLLGLFLWCLLKVYQAQKFKLLLNKSAVLIDTKEVMTADLLDKYKLNIAFKSSAAISGPLISGLIKPTIYLPQNFFAVYHQKQRQYILEHELTHAKRKDLWAQLMAEIFKALFWFNPLVHMAWAKFQQDQELACDHQVLKKANMKTRQEYGMTLKKGLSAVLTPHSLTFFNHKHERFIMLAKHKNSLLISMAGIVILAAIAYVMLTKTTISFQHKNTEINGQVISYDFNDIPLEHIAMLVSHASGQAIKLNDVELLQGQLITAQADKVHAYDFFDALLNDHGFQVTRQDKTWQFSTL